MGAFDYFAKKDLFVQLKVGPCCLKTYNEGDSISVKDGVYRAYEGFVVIVSEKVVYIGEKLDDDYSSLIKYDKWGNVLDEKDPFKNNPVVLAMDMREGLFK
jgi:hypothetical protein